MSNVFTDSAMNDIITEVFRRMSTSSYISTSYPGSTVAIDNIRNNTINGSFASFHTVAINGYDLESEIISLKEEVKKLKHLLCMLAEDEEKLKKHVILADLYNQYKTAEALLSD